MAKRRSPLVRWEITMLVIFAAIAATIVTAPLTLPHGSVKDLSGRVGTLENQYQESKMNLYARIVYTVGDIECHQLSSRSFYINGNQMPVCSRDTGIIFGLVMGMLIALVTARRFNIILLGLGLVPMALDGGLQAVTSYESMWITRTSTGLLAGIAGALLLRELAARYLGDEQGKPLTDR